MLICRSDPLVLLIKQTSELLLVLGKIGVLMDPLQQQVSRPQIEWSAAPQAVACSFPYIVALHTERVEVHSLYDTTLCIQTIAIEKTLAVSGCDTRQLWAATPSRLYQLCQLSVAQQVSALVLSKKVRAQT